jgi:hypothetical protein
MTDSTTPTATTLREHCDIQNRRIADVFDKMIRILNDWKEEAVYRYPASLPSFDELAHAVGEIRFDKLGSMMRGVQDRYAVGDRVRAKHELDRWPNFIVPAGSAGTIQKIDEEAGQVWVKMDAPIKGCEEWDNCVLYAGGYSICFRCAPTPEAQGTCTHGREFVAEMTLRQELDYDLEPEPEIDQLRRMAQLVLIEGAASDHDPVYEIAAAWKRGAK